MLSFFHPLKLIRDWLKILNNSNLKNSEGLVIVDDNSAERDKKELLELL